MWRISGAEAGDHRLPAVGPPRCTRSNRLDRASTACDGYQLDLSLASLGSERRPTAASLRISAMRMSTRGKLAVAHPSGVLDQGPVVRDRRRVGRIVLDKTLSVRHIGGQKLRRQRARLPQPGHRVTSGCWNRRSDPRRRPTRSARHRADEQCSRAAPCSTASTWGNTSRKLRTSDSRIFVVLGREGPPLSKETFWREARPAPTRKSHESTD